MEPPCGQRYAAIAETVPLATPARSPAIPAFVAASVARHDGAALGAQRRIRHGRRKGQILLRIGLGGPQRDRKSVV